MWCRLVFIVGIGCVASLLGDLSECQMVRRIRNQLLLHDVESALEEAEEGKRVFPASLPIHIAYLEALCKQEHQPEVPTLLRQFLVEHADLWYQKALYESLAWGIVERGSVSQSLVIRYYTLQGASMLYDSKAIAIIQKELRASSALLRLAAVMSARAYRVEVLQQELLRLLEEEKIESVRIGVLQVLGVWRLRQAKPQLQAIIANPHTSEELRQAAIGALVQMYDMVPEEELCQLIQSPRIEERRLACLLVGHLQLQDRIGKIAPLVLDDSAEVRICAMNTLAMLQVHSIEGQDTASYIQSNLQSPHLAVRVTAAFLALIIEEPVGSSILQACLQAPNVSTRRLAAGALAASGGAGIAIATQELNRQTDPYVCMALARLCITQRVEVQAAARVLYKIWKEKGSQLWMYSFVKNPLFFMIVPSSLHPVEGMMHYNQKVDHAVQLDVLALLGMGDRGLALEAMREWLGKQHTFFIEDTLWWIFQGKGNYGSLWEELARDQDVHISLQASLLLAMTKREGNVVEKLLTAYGSAAKETKLYILYALQYVDPDPSIVSFLLHVLEEPSQAFRIMAACGLMQFLYQQ